MRIVIFVLLFQLLCAIGIALSYNQWSPYWHGFAENRTLLHSAAVAEHSRVAADLIKMGMDVNAKDNRNWTPLDYALQKGDADMILLLRDRGGYSEQEEQEKIARLKEKEQRRKAKQQEEQRKAQQRQIAAQQAQQQRTAQQRKANQRAQQRQITTQQTQQQRAEQQRKANQRAQQRRRAEQQRKAQSAQKNHNRKAKKQQALVYCYATGQRLSVKACERAKRKAERKARVKQVEAASKRKAEKQRRAQQRKDAERNRCRQLRKQYPGRGYKVRDGRCTSR